MNKISELTKKELARQRDTLNLIASENYPSPKVLSLLGSVWMNKYAEGYPGKRYYAGNIYADELESYVQGLAFKAFDQTGEYSVNLQVLSGSPANMMVYLAALEPGDTVMSLDLASGGHLSHLHATSSLNQFYKHLTYRVKQVGDNDFEIDMDDFKAKLNRHKPKLTIIGFSSYPLKVEFEQICRAAHEEGSLVLADIAHISGLVAAGLHDTPFKAGKAGADFVSMTTHKTLRGPRSAILFSKIDWADRINKTVFPGTSGGPHLHSIAAVGQALTEVLGEDDYPDGVDFKTYCRNIIDTCKALESGLVKGGLQIISPTETHLCLVRLPDEADSLAAQQKLESCGIITNRNAIPNDTRPAWRPSGMRFGTAALASRGLNTQDAMQLGELIATIVLGRVTDGETSRGVKEIISRLKWHYN